MFSYYLPDPIYERLPRIYFLVAAFLIFAPLASVKWVAIGSLLLAMLVTSRRRQAYRETERLRTMTEMTSSFVAHRVHRIDPHGTPRR